MCLIAFDFRPGHRIPLRLVGNRDEFHARPTAALADWDDAPGIVAGRDLQAGGSWLAVHRCGRFVAITNVRDPRIDTLPSAPSRGTLVRTALECDDPQAWLTTLAKGEAWRYAGFNLLVGNGRWLWHLYRGHDALRLNAVAPGLHGLSNADLDTPWPKLVNARLGLEHAHWPDAALTAFSDPRQASDDRLPDTRVGIELERRLSAAFIVGRDYGTRATTWMEWQADGRLSISERRFGPEGVELGTRHRRLSTPPLS